MIHLILDGPGGNLVDRALRSVLSCYGMDWCSYELGTLAAWQLDELVFESENLILRKCGVGALESFAEAYLGFLKEEPVYWWLLMPPVARQWEGIGLAVLDARERFPWLRYCFLLSREFDNEVWQGAFARAGREVVDLMAIKGRTVMLPDLDIGRLVYTSTAGGAEVCLVMPRADRRTNEQVGELLGLAIDRLPLSAFFCNGSIEY
jgi:hypothetical protein